MSQSKKHQTLVPGDRLFESDLPDDDIEMRCETISEVVARKVFPLQKALNIYDVSFKQYLGYLMLRDKPKVVVDTNIMADFVSALLEIIHIPKRNREPKTDKVIADLQQFSNA